MIHGGETLVAAAELRLARSLTTQVQFLWRHFMAYGQIVCQQCDKAEPFCKCEKYCSICKGQEDVHLCVDGLYYCPDCREACDVSLADSRVH